MANVKALLDRCKEILHVKNDAELAARLGIRRERISDYYKGHRFPNNDACMDIADKTGIPLAEVIAAVEIDSAKDEARREAWKRYYKSIGGVAASFVMSFALPVTFILTTPNSAHANQYLTNGNLTSYELCAFVRWVRRRAEAVRRTLANVLPRVGLAC